MKHIRFPAGNTHVQTPSTSPFGNTEFSRPKILLYNYGFHHKNLHAIKKYKQIEFDIVENLEQIANIDVLNYDFIYSPAEPFDISNFEDIKFRFGPHFSTFPTNKIRYILGNNSAYIQPSKWVVDIWKKYQICDKLNIKCIPFGVDTDHFNEKVPIGSRNKVFIYFKQRNPDELQSLEHFLSSQNIEYKIFSYKQKYDEKEYIDYLQYSKYGIWLGCHESQGFAIEEALSCNVPLLVWNVSFMSQEHDSNYPNIPCSSIAYWDERCGEFFYSPSEFAYMFDYFLEKIQKKKYQPRKYILEHLSMEVCENRLIKYIQDDITYWK